MTFWTNIGKAPKRGIFSPKSPGDTNQSFSGVNSNTFMFITSVSKFCQNFKRSDGWMKRYKAKSVIFGQFGTFLGFLTLLGPWGRNESFSEKNFYSAQLDMKIQLAAKFQKNLMDGYPTIVRTDGRTGLITIVPFRLKSGD